MQTAHGAAAMLIATSRHGSIGMGSWANNHAGA